MGQSINLPTRNCRGLDCIQIPQFIFGKRVTKQAHKIDNPKRGTHICDGHGCDQTDAKGDIIFFSRVVDISNI